MLGLQKTMSVERAETPRFWRGSVLMNRREATDLVRISLPPPCRSLFFFFENGRRTFPEEVTAAECGFPQLVRGRFRSPMGDHKAVALALVVELVVEFVVVVLVLVLVVMLELDRVLIREDEFGGAPVKEECGGPVEEFGAVETAAHSANERHFGRTLAPIVMMPSLPLLRELATRAMVAFIISTPFALKLCAALFGEIGGRKGVIQI